MTILVTGASGLIGSHLCKRLAREGYEVVALARSPSPLLESVVADYPNRVKVEPCDIRNSLSLEVVLQWASPRTVFHLAACCLPSHSDMDYIDTNIRGTTNLVNAILRSGVEKFIYASSMSVYSSPPLYLPIDEDHPTRLNTMYGASKLVGEWLCRCLSDRMCSIILRFVSVYGVGDTVRVAGLFMQAALSGKPLLVQGDGTQSSDFIYVDDAVQGLLCARARGATGAYNIGSGRETSIKDLARTVIQVTDSKSCIEFSGKTNKPYRFVSDVSKAKRELGYSPEYSLVEGLRKYKEEMTQCSG